MQACGKDFDSGNDILDRREFIRRMTTSVFASDKDHRDLRDPTHLLAIVSRAAVHRRKGNSLAQSAVGENPNKMRITWAGRMINHNTRAELKTSARCDLAH